MQFRPAKLLIGLLCLTGCNRHSTPPAVAVNHTKPPVPMMVVLPSATQFFHDKTAGVSFSYPADWVTQPAGTALFCAAERANAHTSLTLDVPKLPWHVPGMITCGMVCHGYLDDLRKAQIPDAVIRTATPIKLAGCTARRTLYTGHCHGQPANDTAVVAVRNDHVYILSVDADETNLPRASATLDAAIASWGWDK